MKRLLSWGLFFVIIISMLTSVCYAKSTAKTTSTKTTSTKTTSTKTKQSTTIKLMLNGKHIDLKGAQPIPCKSSYIMLPLKEICDAFKVEYEFNAKEKSMKITKDSKTLMVYAGKKTYTVDGKSKELEYATVFKDNNLIVYQNFIDHELGSWTGYDDVRKIVSVLTYNDTGEPEKWDIGFTIPPPTETNLICSPVMDQTQDAAFLLNILDKEFSDQIKDLETILLQQCDKSTVKKITDHIKLKKYDGQYLPMIMVYDKKTGRNIIVDESRANDINVYYCPKNDKKS